MDALPSGVLSLRHAGGSAAKSESVHGRIEALAWMSFVAAIWVQAINGTNFDFSAYSSLLKEVLGISQVQLNNLAVASDLGKALGWLSGLASLYLPLWIVLLIAVSLGFLGYGVQWLVLVRHIHVLPYWQVYLLCVMAGNSVCWFNTVCYVVCIRNFPNDRGFVLGLSTGYAGLSAAVYTSLVTAITPESKSLYLLTNAVVPIVVCMFAAPFLRPREKLPADGRRLDSNEPTTGRPRARKSVLIIVFYALAIATGVYLLVLNFVPISFPKIRTSFLLALLVSPVCVPGSLFVSHLRRQPAARISQAQRDARVLAVDHDEIQMGRPSEESKPPETIIPEQTHSGEFDQTVAIDSNAPLPSDSSSGHDGRSGKTIGEDHTLAELLTSIDFWLYFMVYLCGGTAGLVFISNLGQISESRGHSKASTFVSLSSSSGFFGRLASAAPDYFLRTKIMLPRPAWLGILMLPMVGSFFVLATTSSSVCLYVATAVLGTCTGAITSIAISTTSELFGLKNFGVNHNILVVNIPLGSLLFGYVAGTLYDRQAKRTTDTTTVSTSSWSSAVCHGTHCYNATFLSWGSVGAIGVVLCVILSIRTQAFYRTLYRSSGTRFDRRSEGGQEHGTCPPCIGIK